jgi:hypothetical protein
MTIDFSALLEGRLQQTYNNPDGDETILFNLGHELPPNVSIPRIQPSLKMTSAPTASPNPNTTTMPT